VREVHGEISKVHVRALKLHEENFGSDFSSNKKG
jgi:hypothetical protein